jgi:hypothetical protein
MDTFPADDGGEPGEAGQERPAAAQHCSTGRLTPAQAGVVDAWRARLREDKALPGQERAGDAARLAGSTNHPRASTSDAVAAAVADMLAASPPDPLELAGYAYRAIRAQWEDSHGRARPGAPVCPPVSYYLPAALATRAGELLTSARGAAVERLRQLRREATEQFPASTDEAAFQRDRYIAAQAERLGLYYTRQIPAGAIARMAIDRWADRSPGDVAAAAVAWCQAVHVQWHRAHRDMITLRRR